MIRLVSKLDIMPILIGGLTGAFFTDAALKILVTVIAMLIGTFCSFYFRKYLKNRKN